MIAEVKLWDMLVGTLSLHTDRRTSIFRFDSDFIKKGLDIAPVLMPLKSSDISKIHRFIPEDEADFQTYRGLPAFVAGSLPDSFGNRIINAWFGKTGTKHK